MKFRVQILDEQDRLLTEWALVNEDDDGSGVDIVKEIAWLRESTGGVTHAEQVASA